MFYKRLDIFFIVTSVLITSTYALKIETPEKHSEVEEITDKKWDQIQKGQWLIGFFDQESVEDIKLEDNFQSFSLRCQKQGIKVGKVFAPSNPGLYVRFLVTAFPKVFYIKNGVAHEVPKVNTEVLINLIKNENWSTLKPVGFLSNPFSVQISLLSHLFVYAVNIYNYEHSIVEKYISGSTATDVVFGLTFIIVGTFLGLLLTCAFGVLQIFFMDSKEYEETKDKASKEPNEKESAEVEEKETTADTDATVRKRK